VLKTPEELELVLVPVPTVAVLPVVLPVTPATVPFRVLAWNPPEPDGPLPPAPTLVVLTEPDRPPYVVPFVVLEELCVLPTTAVELPLLLDVPPPMTVEEENTGAPGTKADATETVPAIRMAVVAARVSLRMRYLLPFFGCVTMTHPPLRGQRRALNQGKLVYSHTAT